YHKPPLTHQEQLDLLEERGLVINNPDKALHLLDKLGYFRLSGYFYPQLNVPKENHIFKEKSYFNSSFQMYCFDRELRLLILGNIEKIEVAFRSKLTYALSNRYDAFWYTYDKLFKNENIHKIALESIRKSKNDSQEDFVIKFMRNYLNNDMPSWMVMEIVTFSHLSKTFSNLKDTSVKSTISQEFGIPYQLFENWLLVLTYSRNICAHHSRFWNRELAIKASKSNKKLRFNWIEQTDVARNRSYMYLSIIKYLLDRINPRNSFAVNITDLFKKYPNIDFIKSMGFPEDWKEQPLWMEGETK
ncbi:unnamed protein product, partial [Ectocarpus sp. 12 AP-2014]